MESTGNIFRFLKTRQSLSVLFDKLASRLFDTQGSLDQAQNLAWLQSQAVDFAELAVARDRRLWSEAKQFSDNLATRAEAKLKEIDVELGGGGHYAMLYFLARALKPHVIVETGVAAGYSSASFLAAIERNAVGKLCSSDFPYFRLASPEQYIGLLVDEKYREAWTLHIDGDKANLARILNEVGYIDLFHYDSDKRYRSKQRSLTTIETRLSPQAHLVFDDIQDDSFFHDLVINRERYSSHWSVIAYEGKFIGWIHPHWD